MVPSTGQENRAASQESIVVLKDKSAQSRKASQFLATEGSEQLLNKPQLPKINSSVHQNLKENDRHMGNVPKNAEKHYIGMPLMSIEGLSTNTGSQQSKLFGKTIKIER